MRVREIYQVRVLRDAVTYLRESDERITTLLIGAALTFYGGLIVIPAVFLMGYIVRVLRAVAAGERTPPRFDRWGNLFYDGVRAWLVWSVFLFLPVVNVLVNELAASDGEAGASGMAGLIITIITGGGIFSILDRVIRQSVAVVGTPAFEDPLLVESYVLLALVMYIAPAAVIQFANTGRLRSSFDFGSIRRVVASPRYFGAWVLFICCWTLHLALLVVPQLPAVLEVRDALLLGSPRGTFTLLAEGQRVVLFLSAALSFVLLITAFYVIGDAWARPASPLTPKARRTYHRVRGWLGDHYPQNYRISTSGLTLAVFLWLQPLVLTAVLLMGYYAHVVRESMTDGRSTHSFEDWLRAARDGVKGSALWLVYLLPAFVLWLLFLQNSWMLGVHRLTGIIVVYSLLLIGLLPISDVLYSLSYDIFTLVPPWGQLLEPYGLVLTTGLVLLALVPAMYVLPAAVASFAERSRFRDGLDARRLGIVLDPAYARVCRWILLVWVGLLLVALPLNVVWANNADPQIADPIRVGEIPVQVLLKPWWIAFNLLNIGLAVAAIYGYVVTCSTLGYNWGRWRDEGRLATGPSVLGALRPRRSYLAPFVLIAVPGVVLATRSAPTVGVFATLCAVVLGVSYVCAATVATALSLEAAGERWRVLRPVVAPPRATLVFLSGLGLIYGCSVPVFWFVQDGYVGYLAALGSTLLLWPTYLIEQPALAIAVTLGMGAVHLLAGLVVGRVVGGGTGSLVGGWRAVRSPGPARSNWVRLATVPFTALVGVGFFWVSVRWGSIGLGEVFVRTVGVFAFAAVVSMAVVPVSRRFCERWPGMARGLRPEREIVVGLGVVGVTALGYALLRYFAVGPALSEAGSYLLWLPYVLLQPVVNSPMGVVVVVALIAAWTVLLGETTGWLLTALGRQVTPRTPADRPDEVEAEPPIRR